MKVTPNQLRREIEMFCVNLLGAGIAIDYTGTVISRDSSGVAHVTWVRSDSSPSMLSFESGSIDEYRQLVLNRLYSCMLNDGGLLQFTYRVRGDAVVGHRLGFIPCPLRLSTEDLREGNEPLEVFDFYFETELLHRMRMLPLIRFDFDIEVARADHPQSHLHLTLGDCRCPVFGPLSVGHFVRFVFRYFYGSSWRECNFLRDWPLGECDRTISVDESCGLFIDHVR